jgi:SHS2 domain-containing protein
MSFELRDHTADVAVAATGDSLEAVFAAVADGLAAATCEGIPDPDGSDDSGDAGRDGDDRFSVSITAETREALVYDYLAELIYERDVRAVLPVDNEATIRRPSIDDRAETIGWADSERIDEVSIDEVSTGVESTADTAADAWALVGSARGVPLTAIDAREVKAVTYSEMVLEKTPEGWRAYVVFDV